MLVVGSPNSSNSNRLVEVVERRRLRRPTCSTTTVGSSSSWLAGAGTVGITAGASAPEEMVQRVVAAIAALGPVEVDEHGGLVEDVHFALPAEVR